MALALASIYRLATGNGGHGSLPLASAKQFTSRQVNVKLEHRPLQDMATPILSNEPLAYLSRRKHAPKVGGPWG